MQMAEELRERRAAGARGGARRGGARLVRADPPTRGSRPCSSRSSGTCTAFLRETRLTEEEWRAGIDFLTAAGHITDDRRQEFVLLSDVLGASMQTIAINNEAYAERDRGDGARPVLRGGRTGRRRSAATSASARPASRAGSRAASCDTDGNPRAGCGAGDLGVRRGRLLRRPVRAPTARRLAGDCALTRSGEFRFWALTPVPYPIPHDGPVGQLLEATGRSPMRAPHLHFLVARRASGR